MHLLLATCVPPRSHYGCVISHKYALMRILCHMWLLRSVMYNRNKNENTSLKPQIALILVPLLQRQAHACTNAHTQRAPENNHCGEPYKASEAHTHTSSHIGLLFRLGSWERGSEQPVSRLARSTLHSQRRVLSGQIMLIVWERNPVLLARWRQRGRHHAKRQPFLHRFFSCGFLSFLWQVRQHHDFSTVHVEGKLSKEEEEEKLHVVVSFTFLCLFCLWVAGWHILQIERSLKWIN